VDVVLAARNQQELKAIARDLRDAYSVKTTVVAVDVVDPSAAGRLEDQLSDLDAGLVVLAAGFGTIGAFTEAPLDRELEMIAVNIKAVTRLAHTFAQRLVIRGRGGIVLFGSILGWCGVPGQATYAATKAYVQNLAEGLHRELAKQGVDVLSVAPGPVHSGFAARAGMTMNSATTPEIVARSALAGLGRRMTVVPGFRGKFLTAALAMLPRRLRIRVLALVIRGMRKPTSAQPAD
jgi:uncharacterized protein